MDLKEQEVILKTPLPILMLLATQATHLTHEKIVHDLEWRKNDKDYNDFLA